MGNNVSISLAVLGVLCGCARDVDLVNYQDVMSRMVGPYEFTGRSKRDALLHIAGDAEVATRILSCDDSDRKMDDVTIPRMSFLDACRVVSDNGFGYVAGELILDVSSRDLPEECDGPLNVWEVELPAFSIQGESRAELLSSFYKTGVREVTRQGMGFSLVAVGDGLRDGHHLTASVRNMKLKDALHQIARDLGMSLERTEDTAYMTSEDSRLLPEDLYVGRLETSDLAALRESNRQLLESLMRFEIGPIDCTEWNGAAAVENVLAAINGRLEEADLPKLSFVLKGDVESVSGKDIGILPRQSILDVLRSFAARTGSVLAFDGGAVYLDLNVHSPSEDGVLKSGSVCKDKTLADMFYAVTKEMNSNRNKDSAGLRKVPVLCVGPWSRAKVRDVRMGGPSCLAMFGTLAETYGCECHVQGPYIIVEESLP